MRLARRREWIEKRMMIDQNVIKHRPAAEETLHQLKKENKDKGYELKILHSGNKKIVVSLLAKGASPCVRNAKGATPLHLACQFKQMDIVKVSILYFKY